MKKYTPIDSNISFADASLTSFNFEGDRQFLSIFLESWNEKVVKLNFESVLFFDYNSGDFISGIFQTTDSPIINDVLVRAFVKFPDEHDYKLFLVSDIDDFPIVRVVSKSVSISIN